MRTTHVERPVTDLSAMHHVGRPDESADSAAVCASMQRFTDRAVHAVRQALNATFAAHTVAGCTEAQNAAYEDRADACADTAAHALQALSRLKQALAAELRNADPSGLDRIDVLAEAARTMTARYPDALWLRLSVRDALEEVRRETLQSRMTSLSLYALHRVTEASADPEADPAVYAARHAVLLQLGHEFDAVEWQEDAAAYEEGLIQHAHVLLRRYRDDAMQALVRAGLVVLRVLNRPNLRARLLALQTLLHAEAEPLVHRLVMAHVSMQGIVDRYVDEAALRVIQSARESAVFEALDTALETLDVETDPALGPEVVARIIDLSIPGIDEVLSQRQARAKTQSHRPWGMHWALFRRLNIGLKQVRTHIGGSDLIAHSLLWRIRAGRQKSDVLKLLKTTQLLS